ncbi:Ser-Thr-rich glycosyl-phosphatidyl-inositol-anchored membrane family-domain-containing protein [Cadophora sp. MPI-SDFR-AT-0126]|nr:Ser-Thr-rich glycosyl-phosphatidyl-inositol-anchored membrane family-domain-containing protein [Leotiomycetes sp. MPI-SDFR-AT-0126]
MQFSSTLIFAAIAALASAQNPFTFTSLTSIKAGEPFNITWAPSTGSTDTVSLVLRQGDSSNLETVETIASKIDNTGSYVWTPSTSIANGDGYAFQIIDDGNSDNINYSNQFSISSSNTATSAASFAASAAPSSASSSDSSSEFESASASSSSSGATATTTSDSSTAASTTDSSSESKSESKSAAASGTASGSAAASGSSGGSSRTSSSAATRTQSAVNTPTGNLNGAGSLKVGGGLLAVLGAVMALL